MGGRYAATAVRATRYGRKPKSCMKNTGACLATVTRSWLLFPEMAAGTTTTPSWVLAGSKPLRLAWSVAGSVAWLRDPAGIAWAPLNGLGMKTTPERAAADAARSAAMLYMYPTARSTATPTPPIISVPVRASSTIAWPALPRRRRGDAVADRTERALTAVVETPSSRRTPRCAYFEERCRRAVHTSRRGGRRSTSRSGESGCGSGWERFAYPG